MVWTRLIRSVLFAASVTSIESVYAEPGMTNDKPVLFAAGSLRAAMDDMMRAYQLGGGASFTARYGPSGKLREEVEGGARVDVFASASTAQTDILAHRKLLGESRIFTHNDLCVAADKATLVRPFLASHTGLFI